MDEKSRKIIVSGGYLLHFARYLWFAVELRAGCLLEARMSLAEALMDIGMTERKKIQTVKAHRPFTIILAWRASAAASAGRSRFRRKTVMAKMPVCRHCSSGTLASNRVNEHALHPSSCFKSDSMDRLTGIFTFLVRRDTNVETSLVTQPCRETKEPPSALGPNRSFSYI